MSRNKRQFASLTLGVLIPLLALACSFAGAALANLWRIEWFGKGFLWLIAWPFALLKPITPNSEDASREAMNLRTAILVAVPLLDAIAYSLLAYIFLSWRQNRKMLLLLFLVTLIWRHAGELTVTA
jgi:hypothetical protein